MAQDQTEPCTACGSILDITGAPLFASRTCPVCGEQIHVHRQFKNYELLALIGQGGQGTVYRALDQNLDRPVALKLLRLEHGGDPEFVKKFEHEARLTASINHPNVIRVYSFGAEDDNVYLAMELVDGGTFDEQMEKLGRVPEARVLQVGIQVAQGLRAGLEKGLIHRDVKPGNILFGGDGSAKIVDFGLAVFHEQEAAGTGDIWGTPYYLSPERLQRQQEDFRSDIYSLGAALFHAIAGRPPFEAEDAGHVALKHLTTQAVSLQTFAPDVSNATAYLINRTLAKNRDDRPASYDEFIEQLQFARDEALAGKRKGGNAAGKARVVIEDASTSRATNWVAMILFGVLVLGLITGGFFLVKAMRGGGEEAQTDSGNIDSFGPGWTEARQLLIDGKWKEANGAFGALAAKSADKSKQSDWAIIHEALAVQFSEGGEAAAKVLNRLPDNATPLRKFFADRIRPLLASGEVVTASQAADFNPATHEALGALFLALRDYELGSVENAGPLFNQFTSLTPEPTLAWLAEYKELAKPYQNEFTTFNLAADAWKNASNERQQLQAIGELRNLPAKLPKDSKLLTRAKTLLTEAERKLDQMRAAKNKGNFAYKAKATASGSNKNEGPEKAVDGDTGTRWSVGGAGAKWLAVDLGSPRNISRWVLTTAPAKDAKPDQNLASFKLQRSDDGKAWTDVDAVEENRCAIVDRVVAPFTAKQVRVLISKETRKPADKTARIHEFALGIAADQAKAGYGPEQNVAMRFSPKTDFITGPVGDTGAAGSVAFAEADGKFTVKGSGADIWGNADAFQFVWQPVAGNCEIVARVLSVQAPGPSAKIGLMIRSDVTRDASGAGVFAYNGKDLQFVSRNTPGKPSTQQGKPNIAVPHWLKLARQGDAVISYQSADGKVWNEVGRETLTGMEATAFVGLAVCSHDRNKLATAQFSDVQIKKTNP